MGVIVGSLYDKAKDRISKGVCPFCNTKGWDVNPEMTQRPSVEEIAKIKKGNYIRVQDLLKAECQECGYIAYFDMSKVTK